MPAPTKLTREQRDEFDEQGYLIVRGLLDVGADIEPCRHGYIDSTR